MAGSRNRHPFEGALARAKGSLRLWAGQGAAYSPKHRRKIPLSMLAVVGNVESVAVANAFIRRIETRGSKGGGVKVITGTGFHNAIFIEQSNTWWMLTGGDDDKAKTR